MPQKPQKVSTSMFPHFIFDVLACLAALTVGLWQKTKLNLPDNPHINGIYIFVLLSGTVIGGYGFGTWNLIISHTPILAHSILGALVGGIVFIELYKMARHICAPTGAAYALPFCMLGFVGRIGCFLGGLDDMTYGIPSNLPWAVDFGDGIPRHPVQLYESLSMLLMMVACVVWLKRDLASYLRYAFPIVVGFYALQRFFWEFLKPYHTVVAGFNLFHILCLGLMIYSSILIYRRRSNV